MTEIAGRESGLADRNDARDLDIANLDCATRTASLCGNTTGGLGRSLVKG